MFFGVFSGVVVYVDGLPIRLHLDFGLSVVEWCISLMITKNGVL